MITLTACQNHQNGRVVSTMREAHTLALHGSRKFVADIASVLSMGAPVCCPAAAHAQFLMASVYRQLPCRNCGGPADAHRDWCGTDPDKAATRYVTGVPLGD